MINNFKKQNINFIEILFTEYKYINKIYSYPMNLLLENNELIAHYNPVIAVKCMKGMASEKYHALEHPYPSKIAILEEKGYDPKQLHHILRIKDFLPRYIDGEAYKNCLIPNNADFLKEVKNGLYNLEDARKIAKETLENINIIAQKYEEQNKIKINTIADEILNEAQIEFIKINLKRELGK